MKAATITESSGKSVELKEAAGIFECLFEHEVKATKAEFNWKGKAMPREMWLEVLAFFKWTQDVEKSEAQVRLFVHPEHGWMAWAFPQQGGTSMTTKELDTPEAANQRALNIPEGYIAFGTVHHHCTCSAFQSGTDTADEKNVDGLHITVGKMDSPMHDIHCRIYIKGHRFEPDMSAFWDIGEDAALKIKFVADLGFEAGQLMNKVARSQMCEPAPKDHPFNAIWRENYIVPLPVVTTYAQQHQTHSGHGDYCIHCGKWVTNHTSQTCRNKSANQRGNGRKFINLLTAREVLEDIYATGTLHGIAEDETFAILTELCDGQNSPLHELIFDLCRENNETLESLWNEVMRQEVAETKTPDEEVKAAVTTDAKASVESIEEAWARQRAEGGGQGWDGYGGM